MTVCTICGGTEFESHGGHYYCIECSTQTQDIRDEQDDEAYRNVQTSLFLTTKSTKAKEKKDHKSSYCWITYEAYNVIICQQVKALIKMGASPKLKDVVLQLWAFYLRKNEIAFKEENDPDNWEPCLSAFPRKRDIQILTGETEVDYRDKTLKKKKKEKKKRKKKNVETQEENNAENEIQGNVAATVENDAAMLIDVVENLTGNKVDTAVSNGKKMSEDADVTTVAYKKKKTSELKPSQLAKTLLRKKGKKTLEALPYQVKENYSEFMSLPKTLCFCYLGLLLLKEDILLCDIIRFATEGYFPYMDATHHLPDSMELQGADWAVFTPAAPPNLKKTFSLSCQLATFIGVTELPSRSLLPIAVRFIKDLGLPDDFITVVKNLLEKYPSSGPRKPFQKSLAAKVTIPMYEVEAMAHVLVAAKLVFGLDGKTERKLSKYAYRKNAKDKSLNYFVWDEWMANTKLKELFLHSRNIPHFYLHEHALDVELIHSNYLDVLKTWTHKVIVPKKNYRYAHPQFRKEMKKVFSEAFAKSSDDNQLVCSASSFPLQGRLCQQVSLMNKCHQYSLSQADCESFLRNFSTCSLLFIFQYWGHHKSKRKLKHNRRMLAQDIQKKSGLNSCEKPDNNCALTDALESERLEISTGNELPMDCTEGHTEPQEKLKENSDSCTEKSKKRKRDKHSEVQIHKKKKSQKENNRADSKSENVRNQEQNVTCDVEDTSKSKKKKNQTSKNSKTGVKSRITKKIKKSKERNVKNLAKKKKREKSNKGKKSYRGKSKVFSKNYWYVNYPFNQMQQACNKLPDPFKWLLKFTSEMIETTIDVLYYEVVVLERSLFGKKLKSK